MKENPRLKRLRDPSAAEQTQFRREGIRRIESKPPREDSKIPDDVIDEMLAELREAENVTHE